MISAMISAFLGRLAPGAGAAFLRGLAPLALIAAAAFAFWRGIVAIEGMVADARAQAIEARDAYWTARIEKSNAEVALRQLQDAHIAQQRSAILESQISDLNMKLSETEKSNAALPNGDGCGLGRDRGRLLNTR